MNKDQGRTKVHLLQCEWPGRIDKLQKQRPERMQSRGLSGRNQKAFVKQS